MSGSPSRPVTGLEDGVLDAEPAVVVVLLGLVIIELLDDGLDLLLNVALLPVVTDDIHNLAGLLLLLRVVPPLLSLPLLHPPEQLQLALHMPLLPHQTLIVVFILLFGTVADLHMLGELVGGEGHAAHLAQKVGGDVGGVLVEQRSVDDGLVLQQGARGQLLLHRHAVQLAIYAL